MNTAEVAGNDVMDVQDVQRISPEELAALEQAVPESLRKALAYNTPDQQANGYKSYLSAQELRWVWNGQRGEAMPMAAGEASEQVNKLLVSIDTLRQELSERMQQIFHAYPEKETEILEGWAKIEQLIQLSKINGGESLILAAAHGVRNHFEKFEKSIAKQSGKGTSKKGKRAARARYETDDEDYSH